MQRSRPNYLGLVSIALLLTAMALLIYELVGYSRQRAHLPVGLTIAGVPVGGLTQTEALDRMLQVYGAPVQVHYGDAIILLTPASIGFQPDTEVMMAAAELERSGPDFWAGFWDFLWNRLGEEVSIPLRAEYSSAQLESVLRDIAARYDDPPRLAKPIPGTPNFKPGIPGRVLDISRAEELIGEILQLPYNRRVNLPVLSDLPPRPTMNTLEILIKQIVEVAGFDGLVVFYMMNLRSGDDLHFAFIGDQEIDIDPDIAFGAASINKIGILTAFFRNFDKPLSLEAEERLIDMITLSGNESSDWLMDQIGEDLGPLLVTETLHELGLANTYIAGYYYPRAPLLRSFSTPANMRTDVNTQPDPYTQTSASDIGMLLSDIYACTKGGGTLLAVYPAEIHPEECRDMVDLLSQNKIGFLIEAGVPDGTRVAHKHGWPSSPFDMIGDTGIVFSPGGDYVLSIFLYKQEEMIWDPTAMMFADLSRAVYNYFNPPIE